MDELKRYPSDQQIAADIREVVGDAANNEEDIEAVVHACINLQDVDLFNKLAAPIQKPLQMDLTIRLSQWVWQLGFQPVKEG